MIHALSRRFFGRDPVEVAPEMLGLIIVRRQHGSILAGRIVETEAYRADDPASHSFRGETPRNRAMFLSPGFAYVYLIYGVHHCLNVVCREEGVGEAVLIRALEPVRGVELMERNRFGDREQSGPIGRTARATSRGRLTSGPGVLCQALGITRELHDGLNLLHGESDGASLWIESGEGVGMQSSQRPPVSIASGPRIGITKAVDRPWRFWIEGCDWVSRGPSRGGRRRSQ